MSPTELDRSITHRVIHTTRQIHQLRAQNKHEEAEILLNSNTELAKAAQDKQHMFVLVSNSFNTTNRSYNGRFSNYTPDTPEPTEEW